MNHTNGEKGLPFPGSAMVLCGKPRQQSPRSAFNAVGETFLPAPPPQSRALWGRIKEGAEGAVLMWESNEWFFALPSIPSRKREGSL